MKFTLSWLKEYLETNSTLEEICESLTSIGLEVESVDNKAKALGFFSVAQIIETAPHENSNKLKICKVKTKDSSDLLQIICGAPNARTGLKVAYAPIGSVIPSNQLIIKKAKIAGVESNGMLCSARELGIGNEDSGIIEVDEEIEIGTKITDLFNLNDAVIEINVTPNRGDCLGIYGIASDLAAKGLGTLKKPEIKQNPIKFTANFSVKNEAIQYCNFAAFRQIKNIKNSESPKWLKNKLNSIGVNSISAVVDVTNYVMFVLNRPLHAYDSSKVNGQISVRFSKNGEKFTSLKNDEFLLDDKILTISDSEKVIGIAGIVGSSNSGCSLETSEIILESAFFQPSAVSYSGRKLNILSDARYRFERGIDSESCIDGIEMATQLILEICGGEASEIKTISGYEITTKKIEFDFTKISKLIGIKIAEEEVLKILSALNFATVKVTESKYLVTPPSNRSDISQSEDLVEEVIRIFGYDKIIPQPLATRTIKKEEDLLDKSRKTLCSKGLTETINWSFCDSNLVEIFSEKNDNLMLTNPISIELNHMRPNLIIGLLESYKRNSLRNFNNLSLFEIGKVFEGLENNQQKTVIAGIRAGKNKEQDFYQDQRDFDVFDVKKDLLDVVEIFGIKADSIQIDTANAPKYYHPHRFAALKLGKNIIGYFGEINPKITKKFDLKNRLNAFEILVDNLPNQQKSSAKKAFLVNDLQMVERDFAFLMNKDQKIGDVIKTISNCEKQLIKEVVVFDIFSGKNIDSDKKSVALRVKLQPIEKTFTSDEIDAISSKIIESVGKFYGATLRV